eukprot:638733-Pelagomonas_calceolata.AAC.2
MPIFGNTTIRRSGGARGAGWCSSTLWHQWRDRPFCADRRRRVLASRSMAINPLDPLNSV